VSSQKGNSRLCVLASNFSLLLKALHNAWSPIMAAIFAGNGVVVKCSEQVVWSTSWFVGAMRECLSVCGFDPELVQVSVAVFKILSGFNGRPQLVCCWPEEAEALTSSPWIKHITFIGSEEVGRKVSPPALKPDCYRK